MQVAQETSTVIVEEFLGRINNQWEGICWAVYDFDGGSAPYTGGVVITSMKLIETDLE